jgi:chorismate mutase
MFHCLHHDKLQFLQKMAGFLVNDEIGIKKRVRGEEVRQPISVDKTSPAPANPLLSALLKRNKRGDTLFHVAARKGDRAALEAFCFGLPSNDIHAIFTRLPDSAGLTLSDLVQMENVKAKLTQSVKAGKLDKETAQSVLREVANSGKDAADFIVSKRSEIEELASDTKGGAPLAPNFDMKRAITLQPSPAAA